MQRPTSLGRPSPERHDHVIDIRERDDHVIDIREWSPKMREACGRWGLRRSLKKHSIHAISVIIFLSFFILWWYSYPVTLENKDGQIVGTHRIYMAEPLKDTRDVDLTVLAFASPPNASIPHIPTLKNKAEVEPELKLVSPTG